MLLTRIQARSSNPALVRVAAIVLFAALTALGARITIPLPFTPVPITLQVMVVLLAGLTLGAKDGALSQIVYVGRSSSGCHWTRRESAQRCSLARQRGI